jgi:serine/threonine-protein kinase
MRRVVGELLAADPMAHPRLAATIAGVTHRGADPLGLVGQVIAGFQVLDVLGSGGMGVVYLARDTRLDRPVALKVPLPQYRLDPSAQRRFLQEARAAAALDHPNLCAVHEVGSGEEGLPFIAMALCAGETLKTRIARTAPVPLAEALALASQVARGLSAIHAADVIHGDLKPGNLMVLPDGTVKILDFGLARAWNVSETDSRAMRGTPAYMAPEQLRNTGLDARTDLWALGVILYEMLTGFQPFRGQSEISVAHAIVHAGPMPLGRLRADLPADVESLVHSLIEKRPERRPATAVEVANQLDALASGGESSRARRHNRGRKRWFALAGAAAVIAAVAAGIVALRRGAATSARNLRPGLLAVAPFDVRDPSLDLWREGLADLLSRDLDGAGPLTTVPQSVVQRRWSGPAERAGAEELGGRTSAELVVYGAVARLAADSVSLRATLLDRTTGTTSEVELTGAEEGMGGLADSLGLSLLRLLGQFRPIGSVRNLGAGTHSFPALKEFLRGEQFYRRGNWDSAAIHYDRAINEDGQFALAFKRMSQALSWGARLRPSYRPYAEYHARAVALNHGLSVRDSMLLRAESLRTAGPDGATPSAYVRANEQAIAVLQSAALRYPADPEVWYDLGEARYHASPANGGSAELAFEAFSHGVELDPGFSPSYEHLLPLALQLRHPDLALAYSRAGAALHPSGERSLLGVAALLIDPRSNRLAIRDTIAALPFRQLGREIWNLIWATDSAEVTIALARRLASGANDSGGTAKLVAAAPIPKCFLSFVLAFRGHFREAERVLSLLPPDELMCSRIGFDAFPELALAGMVPDAEARRQFDAALHGPIDWNTWAESFPPRPLRALPWWYAHGDTLSIKRMAMRMQPEARRTEPLVAMLRAQYVVAAATAYLALARGDTAAAIGHLQALSDSLCVESPCYPEMVTLARLLTRQGDDRRAAAILDRWDGGWDHQAPSPMIIPAALDRGGNAERLGDTAMAVNRYEFVAEAWQHADSALQPYVQEARAGLQRLHAAEPAGRP